VEAVGVVESVGEGDRSVAARLPFDRFFAAEYRRVVGLTTVLCGRPAVAEELAQDAFMAAFRHWDRISGYDDPAAWVRRVAVNLTTSALRRRTREARALFRTSRRRPSPELELADPSFWEAVRALPARQAQCVALHYLEDRPPGDIASLLGIAEPTVRVHLHRGRTALAARLGEDLDEEEW
jgi:RNA polymerase sigma-70 factor (ECF subfamily)